MLNETGLTNNDSFLLDNGSSGFSFDLTGNDNKLAVNNSEILRNAENGIEILSDRNTVNLSNVEIYNNGEWGLNISGNDNRIEIGSSSFTNNGSGAILIDGANNTLLISDATSLTLADIINNGSNNTIQFV